MKKVIIKQFDFAEVDAPKETFGFLKIPVEHKLIRAEGENLEVSDGYHTFDELYEHRIALYIALCKNIQGFEYYGDTRNHGDKFNHKKVWRSKLHHDGSSYDGWFIMGIGREEGSQISYHLPERGWLLTEFAETLEKAPKWDGHTSEQVIHRILKL